MKSWFHMTDTYFPPVTNFILAFFKVSGILHSITVDFSKFLSFIVFFLQVYCNMIMAMKSRYFIIDTNLLCTQKNEQFWSKHWNITEIIIYCCGFLQF